MKLFPLLLLSACLPRLSPVGPSICPKDLPTLWYAADAARLYWNSAGLKLDPPCTSDAVPVELAQDNNFSWVGLEMDNVTSQHIYIQQSTLYWVESDPGLMAGMLAHELGHALGFGHQKETESIMFPWVQTIPSSPSFIDVELACSILSSACIFGDGR